VYYSGNSEKAINIALPIFALNKLRYLSGNQNVKATVTNNSNKQQQRITDINRRILPECEDQNFQTCKHIRQYNNANEQSTVCRLPDREVRKQNSVVCKAQMSVK
jgi:hypothetical protein